MLAAGGANWQNPSRMHASLKVPGPGQLLALWLAAAPCLAAPDWRAEPLTPRNPSAGATLFQLVPAAESGLDFVNPGSPQRTDAEGRVVFFSTSSGKDTAGGVAVGDYDGDGWEDIFLTRPQGGDRLYRNLGGFRFRDVTREAGVDGGGRWSTGASFADIDGDGDLDLAVCGYGCANVVYVNQGDGTFREEAQRLGLAFRGASIMLAFADADGDGDLDAFLLTNYLEGPNPDGRVRVSADFRTGDIFVPPEHADQLGGMLLPDGQVKTFRSGQADRFFRNEGGRFVDATAESGIRGHDTGLAVTWWDFNRDGRPDLHVSNDFFGPDRLWQNSGEGRFRDVARQAFGHTPWFSMGCDSADINNDGLPDLIATDMAGTTHYKDKMGMGEMEESAWFLTAAEPRQYMRNALYLNSGTPRFHEIAALAGVSSSDWTWSAVFGDLDNDGRPDLFITNGMTRDLFNSDLKREEAAIMAAGDRGRAARFWADKPPKRDANIAFRNIDGLRFESAGSRWGLDQAGVSFGAAMADLDNDGDLDVVVNNYQEPAFLLRNGAPESARSVLIRLRGRENRHGVGATVEAEAGGRLHLRHVSLSRGYMSSSGTTLHIGLGEEAEVERLRVLWPGGAVQEVSGVPAGHLIVLDEPPPGEARETPAGVVDGKSGEPLFSRAPILQDAVALERPFDDFLRQPLLPNKQSHWGPGMAWGDVDGDGRTDLVFGGSAGRSTRVFRGVESGFAAGEDRQFQQDAAAEDMGLLLFDADGDGDEDLYCVSGGVEAEAGAAELADRLWLNEGSGRWVAAPAGALPELRESGSAVAAADFDRDGGLDLFVGGRAVPGAYPQPARSILLLNDGRGGFSDVTAERAEGLQGAGIVTSALWTDADDDGWPDLMLTVEWGPVRLFRNAGGRLQEVTVAAGLADRTGWWNGIAAGDFDADGDLDYLTTNWGLNTKYRASPTAPERLHCADFDGDGRMDLVEAVEKDGVALPRRGFSCSSSAMPVLRERLKTFHRFASSTLEEIYDRDRLQQGLRLEINTLESGVWFNEEGRFRFEPLPDMAQLSPAFGVVVEDFDADGRPDAVLAQNFYHPQPETVRMDGGLGVLLIGGTGGALAPVMAPGSGIVVTGDARSLAALDVDGDGRPDLVFGVNGGPVRVFLNRGAGRTFALRLRGSSGNPRAIGARVSVRCGALPVQTREVHAGGGYLSQQPPLLHLAAGGEPTAEITIRWPDGEISRHRVPADGEQVIAKPAP